MIQDMSGGEGVFFWNQEQEGLVTALNEVLERFCREIVLAMQPLINKAPRSQLKELTAQPPSPPINR